MKKINLLLLFTIIGFISLNSCSENVSISESEKDFNYYELNLEKDINFKKVMISVEKLGTYISDPNTKINTDIDLSLLEEQLSSVKRKSDQIVVLSNLTNNPSYLLELIEEKYDNQKLFISKNPEFLNLSEAEQKELIANVVIANDFGIKNKQDTCGDQFFSDIEYCHIKQYSAAAFCGLLSPTIGGALLCGAVVIVDSAICHSQAEADMELCYEASLNPKQ